MGTFQTFFPKFALGNPYFGNISAFNRDTEPNKHLKKLKTQSGHIQGVEHGFKVVPPSVSKTLAKKEILAVRGAQFGQFGISTS